MRYLTTLHPCIGYSDERILVYLATGLSAGVHQRDDDEALELLELSFFEAMEAMQRGEITDAKTMIALFWAERHLRGEWPEQGEPPA